LTSLATFLLPDKKIAFKTWKLLAIFYAVLRGNVSVGSVIRREGESIVCLSDRGWQLSPLTQVNWQ